MAAGSSFTTSIQIGSTTPEATSSVTTSVPLGGGSPQTQASSEALAPLQITTVYVVSSLTDATIFWHTNHPALGRVRWGLTPDLELGTIETTSLTQNSSVVLAPLLPDTRYYFSFFSFGYQNQIAQHTNESFRTQKTIVPELVPNVANFSAEQIDSRVALRWQNPSSGTFDSVRILRSSRFFPRDPFDGPILYEGRGTAFSDTDVAVGETYFYTLFVRDTAGRFSSGAVSSVELTTPGILPSLPILSPISTTTPILEVGDIGLSNFIFRDEETEFQSRNSLISLEQGVPLTVSLPIKDIPESVETIVLTLEGGTADAPPESFFLRLNKDKTAREAVLPTFIGEGDRSFSVQFFGFDDSLIKVVAGTIRITAREEPAPTILGENFWIPVIIVITVTLVSLVAFFFIKLFTL